MSTDQRKARHRDLPWTIAEPPTDAREPLTREEIVAAAIRLADADGLEALSMRRLGQELGAGATSLYWHVKNKDQLHDLMIDALIGEVAADIAPAHGWREQLVEVARALRRVLLRHRHIAPLLGERPTIGPYALDAAERVIGILREAGFDDRTTSLASGALINYASGFALFESRSPGGEPDSPERQKANDAVMDYFRSLPPSRYPNLLAVAAVAITEDDQFDYGLQRLLDGFEADLVGGGPGGSTGDGPAGPNAMLLH